MPSTKEQRKKRRRLLKKKVCRLCESGVENITFKDVELLRRYQTEMGRILPRRITGNCSRHQKMLARAIKRARELSLVP